MGKVIKCIVVILVVLTAGCKKEAAQNMNTPKEGSTIRRKILPEFSEKDLQLWPDYEKLREFMHSRSFWIKDSDTLPLVHPIDMDINNYFDVAPFIVPSDIAGDSMRGQISYRVDYVPSGEFMPDGYIEILWYRLTSDTSGKPVKQPLEYWFQPCRNPHWDTSFDATFRGRRAKVFCEYKHMIYAQNEFWLQYYTYVFFERKKVLYRITAVCETKLQFLGPSSDWWRWLEAHWVWMDEPHPDWSRYPISRDRVRYRSSED